MSIVKPDAVARQARAGGVGGIGVTEAAATGLTALARLLGGLGAVAELSAERRTNHQLIERQITADLDRLGVDGACVDNPSLPVGLRKQPTGPIDAIEPRRPPHATRTGILAG
ncbi:hypothetical protein [Nocardia sp. CC227C]|uniref:hypothetical protein n=1 Tax=Nocardia sp. CC227C TaxID=3044562 RepID=UPI00278C3C36|nr:hypothetical protein [Nocardia sp. CC227C]